MKDDNMKTKWRSVLLVAALFTIALLFACAVRMPDHSLIKQEDKEMQDRHSGNVQGK